MMTELCGDLKNWFLRDEKDKHYGEFTIVNGVVLPADLGLLDGQYIRIVGSFLNDGVWPYKASGIEGLRNESFKGAIWALAIPKAVVDLNAEIDAWKAKYESVDGAAMSPFSSEIFGGYEYIKSNGRSNDGGVSVGGWQNAFANRLEQWRKI